MVGRVSYTRTALIPSSKKHKKQFEKLGYKGFIFPIDEALGLAHLPFNMTISAMLEIANAACTCDSFEDTEQLLRKRTNIAINDDTIRNVTNHIGSIVFANDRKIADDIWATNPPWKFVEQTTKLNSTLYLEVDGAMIQTREKNSLGSSWKENKLGMAFSSDHFLNWVDMHGVPQHKILKKEFTSLIGTNEDFKKHFYSLAVRNGYGKYKNLVLLSDGATWIRSMKDELFHNCQQILDFFHLSEKISIFAKDVFNQEEKRYKPWADKVSKLFKASKTADGIFEIKSLSKTQLKKASFDLLKYIDNNKDNIDYDGYKKKGYFIGSGAIESANRTVLHRRMKLPGMRWNVDSGQNIVTLTSKFRSNLWETAVVETVWRHYGINQNFNYNLGNIGKF